MNGDFSRDTSGRACLERYTRVLLQQGRPLLDADFNEQSAIHHDFLRTLVADLMGRGWRPAKGLFSITAVDAANIPKEGFKISKGHFYVDGILCDNHFDNCTYGTQPFLPHPTPLAGILGSNFVAYVECSERHLCAAQRPELRDIALGGRDTASRAQIVWQVRVATVTWLEAQVKQVNAALTERIKVVDGNELVALGKLQISLPGVAKALADEIKRSPPVAADVSATLQAWFDALTRMPARMRVMAKRDASDNEACTISPDSRYRGRENQLYRVEIHQGGTVVAGDQPTFKWSRENGSVLFAVRKGEEINVTPTKNGTVMLGIPVQTLGYDRRTGLCMGDWVEVTSPEFELDGLAPSLGQVKQIDRTRRTVEVEMVKDTTDFSRCTVLRRWDQTEHLDAKGTVAIIEASGANSPWMPLERGVQIQFQPGSVYRTGDHWRIEARVASGDVLWPQDVKGAVFTAPDGVARHRAAIGHGAKIKDGWTLSDA
jgi:Family of unknown function (DUF6519)